MGLFQNKMLRLLHYTVYVFLVLKFQLIDDEGYLAGYPEKASLNGSHANPAFAPPLVSKETRASLVLTHPATDQAAAAANIGGGVDDNVTGAVEPFGEYDDSGIYGYGIFTRDRCSRCRKSRIVRCTRF